MQPQVKEIFLEHRVGGGTVEYQGKEYSYWLLHMEVEPITECFVGFDAEEEFLYISDGVAPIDRVYFLRHELIEMKNPKIMDGEDRCMQATKEELSFVPDDYRDTYIRIRIGFFKRMLRYNVRIENTDIAFIGRLAQSYAYLLNLQSNPNPS